MPDDPWADLESVPKHHPVEQDVLYDINISDWFTADRLTLEENPHRILVCGCDPKWAYPVDHHLEPGFIEEEEK